jgi:hypothetical protein
VWCAVCVLLTIFKWMIEGGMDGCVMMGRFIELETIERKWYVETENVWNYGSHLSFSCGFWV